MVIPKGVTLLLLLSGSVLAIAQPGEFKSLFDGQSLDGWEGDGGVFRVADGAIVGGNLKAPIRKSEYLCNTHEYADFELRLSARIKGYKNAGVHFRSQRIPDTGDVAGYQADMGFISGEWLMRLSDVQRADTNRSYPLWGSLLDELRQGTSRYPDPALPFNIIAVADHDLIEQVLKRDGWNQVGVIAVGRRIELNLNGGVPTVEFFEEEEVPLSGLICLQLHQGDPSEVWYRDISIRELSAK